MIWLRIRLTVKNLSADLTYVIVRHFQSLYNDEECLSWRFSDWMKKLVWHQRPPYRFWFPYGSPHRSRCTRQTCVSHQPSRSWWAWQTRLSRASELTLLTSLPWFPCWPFLAEIPHQCEQYRKQQAADAQWWMNATGHTSPLSPTGPVEPCGSTSHPLNQKLSLTYIPAEKLHDNDFILTRPKLWSIRIVSDRQSYVSGKLGALDLIALVQGSSDLVLATRWRYLQWKLSCDFSSN